MKNPGPQIRDVLASEKVLSTLFALKQESHSPVTTDKLSRTIAASGSALLERQSESGYWVFELEADTTIPAEYLFLQYFMGTVDHNREARLADYILSRQLPDGSWPLYEGGPGNISATVKAYFALKLAGKDPAQLQLKAARQWVLTHGGAENANVFTRITLALFGQLPWRTVPAMFAEIIWLPRWFFFNLKKVSYWSRCVIVPLLILFAKRPVHVLTPEQGIRELFITAPDSLKHIDQINHDGLLKNIFVIFDRFLKLVEPFIPAWLRSMSLRKTEIWVRVHMRGEGGIGAIFPAMANAVMALKVLGNDLNDPDLARHAGN